MKKVVRFVRPEPLLMFPIVEGRSAYINTIDHPDLSNEPLESNNVTITSQVVKVNEDGSFETLNTLYRPVQQVNG